MILLIVGRIIQAVLSIVIVRVMTGILTPEETGRVYLLISIVNLLDLIFLNPIYTFIIRKLHSWNDQGIAKRYFNKYLLYLVGISFFGGIIVCIIQTSFGIGINISLFTLFILISGYLIASIGNRVTILLLNILSYRKWFIILTLISSVLTIVCSIIFPLLWKRTAEFWLLGQIAGYIIIMIVAIIIFNKKCNISDTKPIVTKKMYFSVISFAYPLSISVGLFWIQMQSYRFILSHTNGLYAVGIFVAGYNVGASIINTVELILTQYLQPFFFRDVTSSDENNHILAWAKVSKLFFPSLMLTVIFIWSTSPYLVKLLLSTEFQSALQYVMWGALVESIRAASGVYGLVAYAQMKTNSLLLSNVVGAVLSFSIGWITIPILNEFGVGLSLFISCVCSIIVLQWKMKKILNIHFPWRSQLLASILCLPIVITTIIIKILPTNTNIVFSIIVLIFIGIIYLLANCIIFLKEYDQSGIKFIFKKI